MKKIYISYYYDYSNKKGNGGIEDYQWFDDEYSAIKYYDLLDYYYNRQSDYDINQLDICYKECLEIEVTDMELMNIDDLIYDIIFTSTHFTKNKSIKYKDFLTRYEK